MPTEPTLTPHAFVTKWRGDTRKERSASQEHFIDLCRLVGHLTPGETRDGSLVFEAGADKMSGGTGWADVWKKGVFGWEYKGPRADLGKAYVQLQQYRDSLQNPPLLVVCDIQTIVIHTNFVNTVKQTTTLTLDDLLTPAGLQTLRNVFTNFEAFRPTITSEQVTKQAAEQFADLAELLRKYGEDPQQIAHFLLRLLFCLFAEDTGLLPAGLFTRLVSQTRHRAPAFVAQMQDLFAKMATGGYFGTDEIKHFNGGLFEDNTVLALDSDGIGILERVAKLDWASIEPSIFGTLFERSLDQAKRAQLGAHYTSTADILLIVEPVLMAPLRRKWVEVQAQARELAAQRDAMTGPRRTRLENELSRLLMAFVDEITGTRVLDPACGSGNFLYVALKQLLDLEKEVIILGADLGLSRMIPLVYPEQLYGIEINELAHELAQVTVWIGYIQWLRDNGFGEPGQPILQKLENIKHMDAILGFDEQGKPYEPEWPEADVIIGNPPFLGDKKMRGELGDTYVEALRRLYEGRVPGGADLVTYWFERARAQIEQNKVQRVGLLATQGIRGGSNRRVLERINQTGSIFWAESDRNWVLAGATVHVSMIGFDDGTQVIKRLNGNQVTTINPNLTSNIDLTVVRILQENEGLCFIGTQKTGPFELTDDLARKMIAEDNANRNVIKQWVTAIDITQRFRDFWIVYFGISTSLDEASQYKAPLAYVATHVKPFRANSRQNFLRERWWLFEKPRPAMYEALKHVKRYILTPRVSKHRVFAWFSVTVVPDTATVVFAREDEYFFGVLHSKVHELWARSLGTQLREAESGFRYSQTFTFGTFPFPWPPGREPAGDPRVEAIAAAAKRLVDLRDAWLNPPDLAEAELKKRTLTNLYNQRSDWLAEAHAALDRAVADAYGWPHDLTDDQILERLLALNLERAAQGGAAVATNETEET